MPPRMRFGRSCCSLSASRTNSWATRLGSHGGADRSGGPARRTARSTSSDGAALAIMLALPQLGEIRWSGGGLSRAGAAFPRTSAYGVAGRLATDLRASVDGERPQAPLTRVVELVL